MGLRFTSFFENHNDGVAWMRFLLEILLPFLVSSIVLISMLKRIYRLKKAGLHFNRLKSWVVFYKRIFLSIWGVFLLMEIIYCGMEEPRVVFREKSEFLFFPE